MPRAHRWDHDVTVVWAQGRSHQRTSRRTSTFVEKETVCPGFHSVRCPEVSRCPSRKVPLVELRSSKKTSPCSLSSIRAWRLLTSLTSSRRSESEEAPTDKLFLILIPPWIPTGARRISIHGPGRVDSGFSGDKGAALGFTQGVMFGSGGTAVGGGIGVGTGDGGAGVLRRPRKRIARSTAKTPSTPSPTNNHNSERGDPGFVWPF